MKKKILFITGRISLYLVIALLLGNALYTAIAKNLVGESLPMPLGFGAAVVLSGSMEPVLSVDDLVIIAKTDRVAPKDIVIYQSDRTLVIHEVVSVNGDEIITKGRANNAPDAPISRGDVKGKLLFKLPRAGVILNIIQNPIISLFIIGAAAFLLRRSFTSEKEKKAAELDEIKEEIRRLADGMKEELGREPSENTDTDRSVEE